MQCSPMCCSDHVCALCWNLVTASCQLLSPASGPRMKPKYFAQYENCASDQAGIVWPRIILASFRLGIGNKGTTTVLFKLRIRLEIPPNSSKIFASSGASLQMFCTRTAVSSAYALTTADGSLYLIRSMRSSAQTA